MPEGDTVYRNAQRLHSALAGATVTTCDIRVPAYATIDLTGEVLEEVASRGKHLLMRTARATIHTHLKMEGRWDLYEPGARWRRPGWQARIVLGTPDQVAVGFQLGLVEVVRRADEDRILGHLGPDLLGADWDADLAATNIASDPRRAIGTALLDQGNLAGVGNVFRSEICFLIGVKSERPVGETDVAQAVDIAKQLLEANKLRSRRRTTKPGMREDLWVYGRRGGCLRCGTPIRMAREPEDVGRERVVYWCPGCQS